MFVDGKRESALPSRCASESLRIAPSCRDRVSGCFSPTVSLLLGRLLCAGAVGGLEMLLLTIVEFDCRTVNENDLLFKEP